MQKVKRAGENVVLGDRFQRGNIKATGNRLQLAPLRTARPEPRQIRIAGIKQDHPPAAQIAVQLGIGFAGGKLLVRRDRPVDEREERQLISLKVDADGRVWVRRNGLRTRIDDCDPDPLAVANGRPRSCWKYDAFYDVFGEDGRFLGAVRLPDSDLSLRNAFISGSTVVAAFEDDAGTGMVKRYRVLLPGS